MHGAWTFIGFKGTLWAEDSIYRSAALLSQGCKYQQVLGTLVHRSYLQFPRILGPWSYSHFCVGILLRKVFLSISWAGFSHLPWCSLFQVINPSFIVCHFQGQIFKQQRWRKKGNEIQPTKNLPVTGSCQSAACMFLRLLKIQTAQRILGCLLNIENWKTGNLPNGTAAHIKGFFVGTEGRKHRAFR